MSGSRLVSFRLRFVTPAWATIRVANRVEIGTLLVDGSTTATTRYECQQTSADGVLLHTRHCNGHASGWHTGQCLYLPLLSYSQGRKANTQPSFQVPSHAVPRHDHNPEIIHATDSLAQDEPGFLQALAEPCHSILFTWNHRPRRSPGLAEWLLRFLSTSCECSTLELPTAPCIGGPSSSTSKCVLANLLSCDSGPFPANVHRSRTNN